MARGTTDPTAVVPAQVGIRATTNAVAVIHAAVPVYNDSASGTIGVSGSSTESYFRVYDDVGSGTITASGSGIESRSSIYSDAGSGTITASGSGVESRTGTYNDAASGNIIALGSGVESYVVTPPVTPPRPPRPGPQQPSRRRRVRLTYRFRGRFTVVESIEVRAQGRYYVDRERRFVGRYEVVASTRQVINANYVVSNLHALLLQEEDELLLLLEE